MGDEVKLHTPASDVAAAAKTEESAGWRSRGRAAKALRLLITLAPIVVALNVSLLLNEFLPVASSWSWAIARVAAIAIMAMASIAVVERIGRRLLPLSMLLRLSLVFPDETALLRFKMALKAGSGKSMEREVIEARTNGLSDDPDRAEQLVLLSTAIGAHDRRTRGHSERVRLCAELLGEELHLSAHERDRLPSPTKRPTHQRNSARRRPCEKAANSWNAFRHRTKSTSSHMAEGPSRVTRPGTRRARGGRATETSG